MVKTLKITENMMINNNIERCLIESFELERDREMNLINVGLQFTITILSGPFCHFNSENLLFPLILNSLCGIDV